MYGSVVIHVYVDSVVQAWCVGGGHFVFCFLLAWLQLAHFHATRVRCFRLSDREAFQCSWRRLLLLSSIASSSKCRASQPVAYCHASFPGLASSSRQAAVGADCLRSDTDQSRVFSSPSSSHDCSRERGGQTETPLPANRSRTVAGSSCPPVYTPSSSSALSTLGEDDCQQKEASREERGRLGSGASTSSQRHPHGTCSCVICRAEQWGVLAVKSQADAELLTLEAAAVAEAAVEEVAEAERDLRVFRGEGRALRREGEGGGEIGTAEPQRRDGGGGEGGGSTEMKKEGKVEGVRPESEEGPKRNENREDEGSTGDRKEIAVGELARRSLDSMVTTGRQGERGEGNEEESPEDAVEAAEFLAETATVAVDEAKEIVGELGHLELAHYREEAKLLQEVIAVVTPAISFGSCVGDKLLCRRV